MHNFKVEQASLSTSLRWERVRPSRRILRHVRWRTAAGCPLAGWHQELDLGITDTERRLLESLLDVIEATWVLLRDHPDLDRAGAEQSLRRLEEIGLVASSRAMSCNPAAFEAPDNYWAITDTGWDHLGLIASPRHGERV